MVVVGLPPNFDSHALRQRLIARKSEGSGKFRIALSGHYNSRVEPDFDPQVNTFTSTMLNMTRHHFFG